MIALEKKFNYKLANILVLTNFWLVAPVNAQTAALGGNEPGDLAIASLNQEQQLYSSFDLSQSALTSETLDLEEIQDKNPATKTSELIKNSLPLAQVPNLPPNDPGIVTPPQPPTPQQPELPQPLPPPQELLAPPTPPGGATPTPPTPEVPSGNVPGATITVERFEFTGNTAFSNKKLAEITKPYTNRPLTFTELLEARSAVTKLYVDNGYQTSGALIPPQKLERGVVTIQVIEGRLEDIKVNGVRRLNRNYVRSRLAIGARKPVNVNRLLESLRLLQLDPLIGNVSAELSAGSQPGTSLLTVDVREAPSFRGPEAILNNSRSPSVGSLRRGFQVREGNLLGLGDAVNFSYTNTDGSHAIDVGYSIPINARNGTLSFNYGRTSSKVIETPFNLIDIQAASRYYDITYRQPIVQTPSQEFALGLTASRRESETSLLEIPFPLSAGADENGRTRISAIRFFQEWTKRNTQEVIAARSQFNFGLGAFDATINNSAPDSRFVSWRGQAQWVRLLARDTLLLVRGDVQLADRALMPLEQYGLGGADTVRGYRQDALLADNGALLTAEVRLPILRIPESKVLLQVIPFVDVGTAWNRGEVKVAQPNTLASVGLGLQMTLGDNISARLDWGIPLVSVKSNPRTWQENGLYFSIIFNPFK